MATVKIPYDKAIHSFNIPDALMGKSFSKSRNNYAHVAVLTRF